MSKSTYNPVILLVLLSLASLPGRATTVVPPADLGQLTRQSAAVVHAEAVESWTEPGGTLPFTVTRFHLVEQVAGAPTGAVFEVREPGGQLGDTGAAVAGSPRFTPGERYLLFLEPAPAGRWRSRMMAYGLLREDPEDDLFRPLPEAARIELLPQEQEKGVEPVGVYRRDALLRHLREVAAGAPWDPRRVLAPPAPSGAASAALHTAPPDCRFLTGGDGIPIRWFGFETGANTALVAATTPGQTGIADGGVSAVQQGAAAWRNHPDSVLRLDYSGTRARAVTCSGNFDSDQGGVVFNDPCEDVPDLSGCSGVLAFGGAFFSGTRTHDGEAWHDAASVFVVVNDGAQCIGEVNFREMMTHELGHTQGFDHHTPANPSNATMSATLKRDGRGAAIAVTDRICASYAYHTFLDVPFSSPVWRFVEAIENAGVTGGCGGGNYCPEARIDRGQMAVFLLTAEEGAGYSPPACTVPMFVDVPCTHPLVRWINELARRGVTGGCGTGRYCPADPVTREQMAVFLLVTLEGSGYSPPACTAPMFSDVPCSSPFARWINELARRGVTGGCGGGAYCPGSVVSRGQMAVFLTATFGLPAP